MKTTYSQFVKESFSILKGYWISEQKWKAITIFVACIALSLGAVYITVRFNYLHRDLYNAIQEMNQKLFIKQMRNFFIFLAPFLIIHVIKNYLISWLAFRWRQHLTKTYLSIWGKDNTFYHVLSENNHVDNPDQRIANDLALVTESTLNISILVFGEVVTLASFITILWELSRSVAISIFGNSLIIPGYLVWAALIYATIGTIITIFTGRKLVLFDFNQEKLEANFRRSLIRLQEKREEIAFYNGIATEEKNLLNKFSMIKENFLLIIRQKIYINIVSIAYGNLANVFPLIVCSPMYFSKAITFGVLMQIATAFDRVKDSFSIIVSNFESLAALKASLNRLIEFNHNIADAKLKNQESTIYVKTTNEKIVKIKNLTIKKPNDDIILKDINFDSNKDKKILITGSSGTGKTTLARAIRGLWKYGNGDIEISKNTDFISQKPFLPLTSLINAIYYPSHKTDDQKTLIHLMNEFNLSHLINKLDKIDDWSNILSLGEQQRVAIIRAILHKPDVLIMDEPTSSLDEKTEDKVLKYLFKDLEESLFIVISHSEIIKDYFDKVIDISQFKN